MASPAGISQPDLRSKDDKSRQNAKEKVSVSDENLGATQSRWYSRLNPFNYITSFVRRSYQSLTGSEDSEDPKSDGYSREIRNATIKIIKNEEMSTTNANGVILFHTKKAVMNKTTNYRFPFKRKTNRPETGDFRQNKIIKEKLLKDNISINEEDGVIRVLVDLGFIRAAVTKALQTTELMTTVVIVFEETDNITDYADEICSDVLEFCIRGQCNFQRTIVFDVRDDDHFCNLKQLIMTVEEESKYDLGGSYRAIRNIVGEHCVMLHCTASVNNCHSKYDKDIHFHNNEVVQWNHLCENAMGYLKQRLEEKCCIVIELDFQTIFVECFEPLFSKKQFKKWRIEVLGLISQVVSDFVVSFYNVDEDILLEVVDELTQSQEIKSHNISIHSNDDKKSIVLCGLESDIANTSYLVQEAIACINSRQAHCLFKEKTSEAKYEVAGNSNTMKLLLNTRKDLEISYNHSRKQLEVYGPQLAKKEASKNILHLLNNLFEFEVNISAQQKRLLQSQQTQDYIKSQFTKQRNNSSIDILKVVNPSSKTDRLKVTVISESKEMCSTAIGIVRSSVKKQSFSTRDPKMARLLDSKQWTSFKDSIKKKHEGKVCIERDTQMHVINIICTSDMKDELLSLLDEQKELKIAKRILDLEPDEFEYLTKWHRKELDSCVKILRVAISVKTPYVNTTQSKPSFELEGSEDDIGRVISYIDTDLFKNVITKPQMINDDSMAEFLSRTDATIFDYLAQSKECFIRIETIGMESLMKWTSPCGRLFFVCKGKANDADIIVQLKQHNTSRPSMKSASTSPSKFEELIVPYFKGAIEKDIFNTNVDGLLQRVDVRSCRVLAFPSLTAPLYNTNVEEIVQLILERIQTYTSINKTFSVENIYFHELWQDTVYNSVVTTLNDYFDDRDDSIIADGENEYEQCVRPRMIFITGHQNTVNDINIQAEIQDLIRREKTQRSGLSRSSSTDSLFNSSERGSIESITVHLHRPKSESDVAAPGVGELDGGNRSLQGWTSETNVKNTEGLKNENMDFTEQETITTDLDNEHSTQTKEKWSLFSKSKKKKKNKQLSKSTPLLQLPPVTEENTTNYQRTKTQFGTPSKGQPYRKSHDDRLFAGSLKDALRDYSGSIGLIEIKSGHNNVTTGTCFMVNGGYIMSAYHIFEELLEKIKTFGRSRRKKEWYESVCIIFGHEYIQDKSSLSKYNCLPYPSLTDPELDLIILKLDGRSVSFPRSVNILRSEIPSSVRGITFFGHPKGQPLVVDPHCQILSSSKSNLREAKDYVRRHFNRHAGCYNGIENDKYFMLHSQEEPGTSGSPGFIIGQLERPVVCCMFLSIFPSFVFDQSTGEQRIPFPNEYMIERALKMSVVFETIQRNNPQLCSEIFLDDRENTPMEEQ